ncbi:MAG: hypothetical protein CMH34_11690 [Microbacterium sp.]|nr:hypothetical protein [Microbacterium sp.]
MRDRNGRGAEPESEHQPLAGVLPLVRVAEHDDGTVTVTLDGNLVVSGPIERSRLGRVLSAVAEQSGGPVRVELTATDGRVFADVLRPPTRPSPFAPPVPPPTELPEPLRAPSHAANTIHELLEVRGEGFIPGEDVQVAAILTASSAAPDGAARGLVDASLIGAPIRALALIGGVSGTLAIRYL